jgi:hypothetical protein
MRCSTAIRPMLHWILEVVVAHTQGADNDELLRNLREVIEMLLCGCSALGRGTSVSVVRRAASRAASITPQSPDTRVHGLGTIWSRRSAATMACLPCADSQHLPLWASQAQEITAGLRNLPGSRLCIPP